MRKLFKERELFKGGNYMRKYGTKLLFMIEKQIRSFVFWEKLWLDNFVSRSSDL